jgi:hypothetical protein
MIAESFEQSGQMMGLLGSDPVKRLESRLIGNLPNDRPG